MNDRPMWYVLAADGKTPVPEDDLRRQGRWSEGRDPHIEDGDVEQDGVRVSTVFLGLDHSWSLGGPPILWETMIFGGEHDKYCERHTSYEDAVAGHAEACQLAFGNRPKRGMKMIVGFTGTRKGMSEAQKQQFTWIMLRWHRISTLRGIAVSFHHGDAEGADQQAAQFVKRIETIHVVAHPAGDDPLVRNRAIVAVSDILVAAPETDKEQLRSGTWATVRAARRKGIPIVMLSRGTT